MPSFQGLLRPTEADPDRKIWPFKQHSWVPIFRTKLTLDSRNLTRSIRLSQPTSQCYREQFPLDLAQHFTVNRAQGQMLRDCMVAVDFDLDNPDHTPSGDVECWIYSSVRSRPAGTCPPADDDSIVCREICMTVTCR